MSYKNYLSKFRITDNWAAHIKRGSLGGVDFAAPVGTPIPAPCDGTVKQIAGSGSGGYYVQLWHSDGSHDEFLHLSKFSVRGAVRQGDIIGYSGGAKGAVGAGSSTGPHIHWHLILKNGKRVDPLLYVDGAGASSGTAKPAKLTGWAGIQKYLKANYGYSGEIDGIPGLLTYKALQKFMRQYGYNGAIDGIAGANTWKAVQRWLQRYYGYQGAIDGIVGNMTKAALDRAGKELGA